MTGPASSNRLFQHRGGAGRGEQQHGLAIGEKIDQPQPLGADGLRRGDDQRAGGAASTTGTPRLASAMARCTARVRGVPSEASAVFNPGVIGY